MPVMGGVGAVQYIRQQEVVSGAHMPIIALTAFAMQQERAEILSKGFDGYVSKPIELNILFDELRRCLPAHLTTEQ